MKTKALFHNPIEFFKYIEFYKQICLVICVVLFATFGYSQNSNKPSDLIEDAKNFFLTANFKEALKKYELSFKSGNTYCDDYYVAAQCAALLKNTPVAIKYIKLSIQNGFIDKDYIRNDEYFRSLNFLSLDSTFDQLIDVQKSKIEAALVKLKDVPCQRLIPFYKKGLWGYMDAKDTSVVIKAIFRKTGFLTEHGWIKYKSESVSIQITSTGKISDMNTYIDFFDEGGDMQGEFPIDKISSADGFKGFTHRNGYVQKHSDIYTKLSNHTVVIKNKHYAFAFIGKYVALIDEVGLTLKGFDFSDSLTELHKAYDSRDTLIWLWFTDQKEGTGFRNEQGVTAHYNVFNNYPGFRNKVFSHHYACDITRQGLYGVFDLWTVKWVVEPQKLEIIDVQIHRKECQKVVNFGEFTLYFLVKTPKGDMYYKDEKLNEYRIK